VHATRDVTAGEELSIAYVELYAAGVDRRAQLQTKKFFQWYTHPPLLRFVVTALVEGWDEWICQADGTL